MNNQTKNMVLSALFIALSVVLTRLLSQQLFIAGVPASRLSAGFVPLILVGMICGPVWGLLAGALADIVGFFAFPSGMYYPLLTVTSALVGFLPGLIVRIGVKLPEWLKTLLCVFTSQILCSMLLQTFFLSVSFGKAFEVLLAPRAIVALVMLPVYFLLVQSVLMALHRGRLIPSRLGSRPE